MSQDEAPRLPSATPHSARAVASRAGLEGERGDWPAGARRRAGTAGGIFSLCLLAVLILPAAARGDSLSVVPPEPVAGEPFEIHAEGERCCSGVLINQYSLYANGNLFRLEADLTLGVISAPSGFFFGYELTFPVRPMPAGAYHVDYYLAETQSPPFPEPVLAATLDFVVRPPGDGCAPSPTVLCIDDEPFDGRFSARASFATAGGGGLAGDGQAVALARLGVGRGGLFWFFAANNPEVLLKVLDGCAINGHRWAFMTAGTNVGFTVEVTDTATGESWTTTNPDGQPAAPVFDLLALACQGQA